MTQVFIVVLNMSLTASYVAIGVMMIRLLLKKTPKIFSYVLWSIVLFRLICPFSFESIFSLIPTNTNVISKYIINGQNAVINNSGRVLDNTENDTIQNSIIPVQLEASVNLMGRLIWVGTNLWILGVIILVSYGVYAYVRLKHRLLIATRVLDDIYETDCIKTPFVLGLIRPRIYIPVGLEGKELDYILQHENTHIKRLDHVIKPIAFITLAIHWFNPIIWLSFLLLVRDMEMSCDESVIKQSREDIRGSYSNSLLSMSVKQNGLISPLAFGENATKDRIKNVLNYKHPTFWVVLVAVVTVVSGGIVLMANPVEDEVDLSFLNPNNKIPSDEYEKIENIIGTTGSTQGKPSDLSSSAEKIDKQFQINNEFSQEVIDLVEKNLKIIMSSPEESSNPWDYIAAHKNEYEDIIKYSSEETLQYMLSQFKQGNTEGLRGYLMMGLCKELLGQRNNVMDESLSPIEWFAQLAIRQEITLPDVKYDGTDLIEKLVYETEVEKNKTDRGGFIIVAPHIFGRYEEENKLKIFVTTFTSRYRLYDKVLKEEGGSIIPVAITYIKNSDGSYSLEEYQRVIDGSYFGSSIKKFCTMPVSGKDIKGLADKILTHYGEYEDIIQLQRENLIKHLKANDQHGVSLYQKHYQKSAELIPIT